jgi:CRP-like cAMP-binding protein
MKVMCNDKAVMVMHPLANISVFQELPKTALERLSQTVRLLEPPSGTRLIAEGDESDAVFAILGGEGHLHIGTSDPKGKSLMLAVLQAGEIVGEIGVIEAIPRTADVVTVGRVRLARIEGAVFMGLLREHPSVGMTLCRVFSERLRRSSVLLRDAAFENLEVRFARQLLYLSGQSSRRVADGVQLRGRYRQSDLADLLGTTTRSIITILQAWRSMRIVEFDALAGHLTIKREDQLRWLVRDEPMIPPGTAV